MKKSLNIIERLKSSVTDWQLEAGVHRKRAAAVSEIARLRLTDEEREAIQTAVNEAESHQHESRAATLRKLLERLQ
jgi:hypothetical protein